MNRKPVILIIENSKYVTGAFKSIVRTSEDLNGFFSFVLVLPADNKIEFGETKRVFEKIVTLNMIELSKRLAPTLLYLPKLFINALYLRRIINENQVSVAHVNDLYNLLIPAARLVGVRVPYVCHVRFLPDKFPPWLFNGWLAIHLRFAQKIVVVSNILKMQLPDNEKIVYIPNELPKDEIHPKHLSRNDGTYSFLYLANYIQGKGQDYALEAFKQIHAKLPNWRMRFVGSDMGMEKNRLFKKMLMQTAMEFGLSEKIEWADFTEDVELEYKRADIVLNFSESESFSLSCVEALFFGRPLIATNSGGPADIVDHEKTGFLIPNRSVPDMAGNMLALATNERLREEISENARLVIRDKFSQEKTTFQLKEIYNFALRRQ